MKRTITSGALSAATLIGLTSTAALATVSGNYINSTNFNFNVTYMPDFDQVRAPGPGVFSLPNDGKMYCVPTSALNLCAYIANHGSPFINPGPGNWQSQSRYNDATTNIAVMGILMSTDPFDGTGGTGGLNGLTNYINNPFFFDVDRYYASGFYAPTTSKIGQVWLNGGVASFCYGRYSHSGNVLTTRHGGHCVTATKVAKSGVNSVMRYRDPSTGGDSQQTQSQFVHTNLNALDQLFIRDGYPRVMSELLFDSDDGRLRIIDSVYAIYPVIALTDSPAGMSFIRPLPLQGYLPPPQQISINPAALQDFASAPDNTAVLALTKAIAGGPAAALHMLDPVSEEDTILPLALLDPKTIKANRHGEFYIIDGRTLICVNVSQTPLTPISTVFPGPGYESLSIDCGDDCVLAIKEGAPAQLLKYPRNLAGTPQVIMLPEDVQLFGKIWFDCCPDDKSIWVCSEKDNKVYHLEINPANGQYELTDVIMQHDIVNPRCINLRLCNQLIFACDEGVKEFHEGRDGTWSEATDGPFAGERGRGLSIGQCFHVSRPDTNFDPEVHSTDWDFDILPEEILEGDGESTDCVGDMDQDGDVDLDDLQEFLFEFGEEGFWRDGDFDQDGTVDLDDLQLMLFYFGTICE